MRVYQSRLYRLFREVTEVQSRGNRKVECEDERRKTMTENVNGLQVDISKYVGEEIARLAVASIGEDTLKQLA